MIENCGLGAGNLVLSATLTASSSAGTLPVSNLGSAQGSASYAWRALATNASVTLDLATPSAVRVVSIHRTNLTGRSTWTLALWTGNTITWTQTAPTRCTTGQAVWILPKGLTASRIVLTLSDPDNPDGFLSVPLMYAGDLWQPVRNFSTSSTSSFTLGVDEATALSGAEFPQMRWIQRKLSIAHQSYGAAEVPTLLSLQRLAATGTNILFVPDPGSSTPETDSLFGRLSGGEIGNPFGAADRRSWTFTHTERL